MNKKILLAIGVAVVAIGAVAGVLVMNKDDSTSNSNQTNSESADSSSDTETSSDGNLLTLSGAGKAQECNFSYSDSNGQGSGKMYTDGKGRGRMQLELTTERGNTGQSNTLTTGGKVYSWTVTEGTSMGFVADASTIQPNAAGSPTDSSSQTAGKNFSLNCKSWSVDEAVLTVPTDVNFITLPTTQ